MLETIFSWDTLWWLMIPVYVVCCFALIIVVLLQKGKGVGFAGAFGVGPGSETLFGPRSAKSLPQRLTYAAAATFMVLALVMSMLSGKVGRGAAPDLIEEEKQSASMLELFGETEALKAGEVTTETVATPLVVEAPATEAPAAEAPAAEAPAAEAPAAEAPATGDASAAEEAAPAESTEPLEATE